MKNLKKSDQMPKKEDLNYDLEDGKFLVSLARKSILNYLTFNKMIPIPENTPKKLKENAGVFVTLNSKDKKGEEELRGCIGFPLPIYPLVRATIEAAKSAAVNDWRFSQVTVEEMKNIVVEVTILTPPKLIEVKKFDEYLEKIVIGRDGLIAKNGGMSGLLLPQVPIEWHWNVREFLEHTCNKAGLNKDCWKNPNTEIHSFQGLIYKEKEPNGEIIPEKL